MSGPSAASHLSRPSLSLWSLLVLSLSSPVTASGSVGSGDQTSANGYLAWVGGGYANSARATFSAVSGGASNVVSDESVYSAALSGDSNQVAPAVAGNDLHSRCAVVAGGAENRVSGGAHAFIGGGALRWIGGGCFLRWVITRIAMLTRRLSLELLSS